MPIEQGQVDQEQVEEPGTTDPNMFHVTLKPVIAQYLRDRAAAHGEAPAAHLARLIGLFKVHYDEWERMRAKGRSAPVA